MFSDSRKTWQKYTFDLLILASAKNKKSEDGNRVVVSHGTIMCVRVRQTSPRLNNTFRNWIYVPADFVLGMSSSAPRASSAQTKGKQIEEKNGLKRLFARIYLNRQQ